jgi:hypothetical protein
VPDQVAAAGDGEPGEQRRRPAHDGPDADRHDGGDPGVAEHQAADRGKHRVPPEAGAEDERPVRARNHDQQQGDPPERDNRTGCHGKFSLTYGI